MHPIDRRQFLMSALAAGTLASLPSAAPANAASTTTAELSNPPTKKLKIGIIGTGARGRTLLKELLKRDDVDVTALADIDTERALPQAMKLLADAGRETPRTYSSGPEDYMNLLQNENVEAVMVATPWEWHCRQGVAAMQAGKPVGMEMGGALNLQECWDYVDTYEKTGVPLFTLENVCYRRDVMAVLNMVREGLFGEIVHAQGGYQHDLRNIKFNDGKSLDGSGVEFGAKGYSEARWRTDHSVNRNGELYPTHSLGPIAMMLNINRGNRLTRLSSIATKARGLHSYIVNHPAGGPDHPNASVKFKLGDIVTTQIQVENGETILLTHDTNLPRPYSLGFRVQGTHGLWMDDNESIYVEGKSPAHKYEPAQPYFDKYDHPLWQKRGKKASGSGHGGMDYFVVNAFVESVLHKAPFPLDVYDLATWYAITPISEKSVAEGGQVQDIPDFTRGKYKTRKPDFALPDSPW